jgi:hypothetical protein
MAYAVIGLPQRPASTTAARISWSEYCYAPGAIPAEIIAPVASLWMKSAAF